MRDRIGGALGAVGLGVLIACQVVSGAADFVVDPAGASSTSGGASSSGASSSSGMMASSSSGGSDAGTDAAGTAISVGGTASYLLGAGLVLANASQTLAVDVSGPFGMMVPVGSTYDFTVMASPVGQRCWIQNGSGTANAPVTNIDVRCTAILQTKSMLGGGNASTTSATFVDIAGIQAVNVEVKRATQALVVFHAPSVVTAYNQTSSVALKIDAAPPLGELNAFTDSPLPVTIPVVVTLMPGVPHTIRPVWKASSSVTIEHAAYQSELDVILLDSLPSFDRVLSTPITTPLSLGPGQTTPTDLSAAVSIMPNGDQPTLFAALIPDLYGDRAVARLTLGNQVLAAGSFTYDINGSRIQSLTPLAISKVDGDAGAPQLKASFYRWSEGRNSTTFNADGIGGALTAVLFKPSTSSLARKTNDSFDVVSSTGFSTVPGPAGSGGYTLSVSPTRPTKYLVAFSTQGVRSTGPWPASTDTAVFVNGAQALTMHSSSPNDISYNSCSASGLAVVPVPAGAAQFELRARASLPVGTPRAGVTAMSQYANLPPSTDSVTTLGIIALD